MDTTTLRKFIRDLLVLVVTTVALYVGENAANIGLPPTATPIVSAIALLIYRVVRDLLGKAPAQTQQ